jgi:nicotinate-nucleotide--dimethylbenzimidazole phosphoribosyltransferase
MALLEATQTYIKPVNRAIEPDIQKHLDNLTKPKGSLGYLEEIAKQYCLITGTTKPKIGKKAIFTFAADHGVADEGVSAFPKEVTPQMVLNMLSGGAAVNVLANHAGAEVNIVDIGVDYDFKDIKGLIDKKVRYGTDNIAKGPAMSEKEANLSIEIGIELAHEAIDSGVTLIGTGEMGIANTTPSAALFTAFMDKTPEEVTGVGTGIDNERLKHKVEVVKKALEVNKDSMYDPISTLASVGGLEIAGICGLIIGAASRNTPVVVDGFISSAGALCAYKICPKVKDYMFFSHKSKEKGHIKFLEWMGAKPILDLDLRLGEGTGAALAFNIIEASIKIYNEMATFESAKVSDSE